MGLLGESFRHSCECSCNCDCHGEEDDFRLYRKAAATTFLLETPGPVLAYKKKYFDRQINAHKGKLTIIKTKEKKGE